MTLKSKKNKFIKFISQYFGMLGKIVAFIWNNLLKKRDCCEEKKSKILPKVNGSINIIGDNNVFIILAPDQNLESITGIVENSLRKREK